MAIDALFCQVSRVTRRHFSQDGIPNPIFNGQWGHMRGQLKGYKEPILGQNFSLFGNIIAIQIQMQIQ